MSAYILPNDHLAYLVNLGYQLQIRGVHNGTSYQSLYLDDEHDRSYVFNELAAQNRTSVAYRYSEPVNPASETPTIKLPTVTFNNLAQFAQALQWVRCYIYQSCEDPGWTTTFAYHYTERLLNELIAKVIECFATTWEYDGAALT